MGVSFQSELRDSSFPVTKSAKIWPMLPNIVKLYQHIKNQLSCRHYFETIVNSEKFNAIVWNICRSIATPLAVFARREGLHSSKIRPGESEKISENPALICKSLREKE